MSLPAVRSSSLDFRQIGMDTPISISCASGEITMSVKSVMDWVAPGAPPQDAMRFLIVCRNLGLNPLIGEAFLLPMGKKDTKYQVVFPKSAYLKKAQENPAYDGHESGITVWFKGEFRDEEGTIRPPIAGAVVVGGWAKVWRKEVSRPVYKRVSFDEYGKDNHIWNQNGNTMIAKVALVAALREAFGLSGYDESEAEQDLPVRQTFIQPERPSVVALPPKEEVVDVMVVDAEPVEEATEGRPVTSYTTDEPIDYVRPDLIAEVNRVAREAGLTQEQYEAMLRRRNTLDVGRLTVAQAEEILVKLRGIILESQASDVFGPTEEEAKKGEGVLIPEIVRSGESPESSS